MNWMPILIQLISGGVGGTNGCGALQAAEKGDFEKSSSPQRLKPDSLHAVMYGLKAVPFKQSSLSQPV
jgi:hypothetical protein